MDYEPNQKRRTLTLVNACVMTFMSTIDGSIVNIALPEIAQSLGASIASVQWVVTSYLVAISATLLVWGRLADLYGRKRFFAAGLALFTLGSLFCGLASGLPALVAARVLQALGAAMAMALVQGIVTSVFPPNERGRALGFVGAVVSIGSLLGPSLGGLLVATLGWRSIFFVNLPVGVAGVVLTLVVMPESRKLEGEPFDPARASLLVFGLSGLFVSALALQAGLAPIGPAAAGFALALGCLAAFALSERRSPFPLVPWTLFRDRVFSGGLAASLLSFMAMFGYLFFMPFYLQRLRGLSAGESGLLMSIYPVCTALLAPLSGALSDRITYRPLTVAGLGIVASAMIALSTLGADVGLFWVGLVIAVLGIGSAVFQSPNTSSVMGSAPRDRLGIAGSLSALFRNLGMTTGTAVAVSVFAFATGGGSGEASLDPAIFIRGFRAVCLAAAAFALLGIAASAGGMRREG